MKNYVVPYLQFRKSSKLTSYQTTTMAQYHKVWVSVAAWCEKCAQCTHGVQHAPYLCAYLAGPKDDQVRQQQHKKSMQCCNTIT